MPNPSNPTPASAGTDLFAALEAAVWGLVPGCKHVRVIVQVLDEPTASAVEITFHRVQTFTLAEPVEVGPVGVRHGPGLPVARPPVGPPAPTRPSPADLAVLDLVATCPGLSSSGIARRLNVKPGTMRNRLGRLVRKRGWLRSNHAQGYLLTDAGRRVLAESVT